VGDAALPRRGADAGSAGRFGGPADGAPGSGALPRRRGPGAEAYQPFQDAPPAPGAALPGNRSGLPSRRVPPTPPAAPEPGPDAAGALPRRRGPDAESYQAFPDPARPVEPPRPDAGRPDAGRPDDGLFTAGGYRRRPGLGDGAPGQVSGNYQRRPDAYPRGDADGDQRRQPPYDRRPPEYERPYPPAPAPGPGPVPPTPPPGGHRSSYQRRPGGDPVGEVWSGAPAARTAAPPAPAAPPATPTPAAAPEPRPATPRLAEPEPVDAAQGGRGAAALGFGRGGSRERELVRTAAQPTNGHKRVVVLSIKGGVGKTTTVAVVGSLLAALRRDRVVALDASSDWGTLAARLSVVPKQTVRELAARGRHAVSEQGVLAQLVESPSGLYVVGSDPQSVVTAALGEQEYVEAVHLLEYVASLLFVDVGAGLQQPFLTSALRNCDQLVVATAATWDSAQSAGAALDWLSARGFAGLVERSIVVMNSLTPTRRRRRGYVGELTTDLARRCRSVYEVPFDLALQPGGRILLRKLSAATRMAFLEVAADVVSGVLSAPPAGGLPAVPGGPTPRPAGPYRSERHRTETYSPNSPNGRHSTGR
jgi:MinD-like ATPase involved in chromosome partitioning or flagellar assembly